MKEVVIIENLIVTLNNDETDAEDLIDKIEGLCETASDGEFLFKFRVEEV